MAHIQSEDASLDSHTYTPPRLPECLSDAHSLKPIVGVPNNEEVKAIHAAIRGLNGILAAPALYDLDLPMQLAQHLFEVQMGGRVWVPRRQIDLQPQVAVYRSTYSFSLIPVEATYTPPTLPLHIPITLEPVVGAPSDEDIRLAQTAVRMMDSLATNSYVFDPDLSANLSQHLFNIQAARYIQHSTQGQFTSSKSKERRTRTSNEIEHISSQYEITALSESIDSTHPATEQHPQNQLPVTSQPEITRLNETKSTPDSTAHLLRVLENINRTLISSQHYSAQIQSVGSSSSYTLMNRKGELPSMYDLPLTYPRSKDPTGGGGAYSCVGYLYAGGPLSDPDLASYLRFYDIGAGLFEEKDGELTIAPDKVDEAAKLLYKHLVLNPGSGWAVTS